MRHLRHQYPARVTLALLAAGLLSLAASAPADAAAAPGGIHRGSSAPKQAAASCPGVGLTASQDPRVPPFGLNPITDESYTEPAAVLDSVGQIEAFALDDDGTVQQVAQTTVNGASTWSDWAELGSPPGIAVLSGPAVVRDHQGAVQVFAIGADCQLWHTWQTGNAQGSWNPWAPLGTPAGVSLLHVTAVRDTNAKPRVFCVAGDGATYEIKEQESGGTTRWSRWRNLGGNASSPPVGFAYGDKDIDLIAIDASGHLEHDTWTQRPEPQWSGWRALGGPAVIGEPAVVGGRYNREEIFATMANGSLAEWVQPTAGSSTLQQAIIPGHLTGSPTAAVNPDGRLEVFADGDDGALQIAIETSPDSGTLTPWLPLNEGGINGLVAGSVAAAYNQAGALTLVGLNAAGYPITDTQTAADSLAWTGWQALPASG
jgi:hypothetical protein